MKTYLLERLKIYYAHNNEFEVRYYETLTYLGAFKTRELAHARIDKMVNSDGIRILEIDLHEEPELLEMETK